MFIISIELTYVCNSGGGGLLVLF